MARAGFNNPIEPMDLANMRANGVRSLLIWCRNCHHEQPERESLTGKHWRDK
jgi:hypothetical protein